VRYEKINITFLLHDDDDADADAEGGEGAEDDWLPSDLASAAAAGVAASLNHHSLFLRSRTSSDSTLDTPST